MSILNGRTIATSIHEYIKKKVEESPIKPHLTVILVGSNPASESYIRMKKRACENVGMLFSLISFPENVTEKELLMAIRKLNQDTHTHGILVQAPLPEHIVYRDIVEAIDPRKDVDGFTRTNIGNLFLGDDSGLVSCTPKGIKRLLDAYRIPLEGKHIVILGRSNIVGKPLALIAINSGATVTICNSKTKNLGDITRTADILIVAIGKPWFITHDMISPGTIVLDVGCTFVNGYAKGDVDFDRVCTIAESVSPVPGGVWPMTVAMILENTWKAFEIQNTVDIAVKNNPVSFRYPDEL